FTNRHHTFFEMLGNFSFGDYFKKDAIAFAMELITSPDWYGIPLEKLYFTVFGGAEVAPGNTFGTDTEAADFWLNVGAAKDRVFAVPGLKDNFWAMGDTGRYGEIWNLVFMQFNRDASGNLNPLPKPSVDTGLGLERTTAVLEHVISNYETDLFTPLLKFAADLVLSRGEAKAIAEPESGSVTAASLRVIADHARAVTFLISDGVIPSNDGRGYVLRKILRRAIHHGRLLGIKDYFLWEMVPQVIGQMSEAYPELKEQAKFIEQVVRSEETRYRRTFEIGAQKLDDELAEITENAVLQAGFKPDPDVPREIRRQLGLRNLKDKGIPVIFPGDSAFRLYDTFGLPLDFTMDVVRDLGLQFDRNDFERAMTEQRTRARASWKGAHKDAANPVYS